MREGKRGVRKGKRGWGFVENRRLHLRDVYVRSNFTRLDVKILNITWCQR